MQCDPAAMAEDFAARCVCIDLEVGIEDRRIHKFGAVRSAAGEVCVFQRGALQPALEKLDVFSAPAEFLLGHNLIAFDLPHLAAARPQLRLLAKPAIDTLRLNPLAFPRNPYHRLVKHYQDGQLKRGRLNDPELDARLTLDVLQDQIAAFAAAHLEQPDLMLAWHRLTTLDALSEGFDALFAHVRQAPRPTDADAAQAIARLLAGQACQVQAAGVLQRAASSGWPLAYALAWLSVAGGNSVMPPWVLHQFPEAGAIVKTLRDAPCADPACVWCVQRHDATKELKRWFPGLPGFRAEPADADGRPLQQSIAASAMRGEHALGILPTGTGKSICYQLPALSRFDKTGALTLVVSPLVALMADQVAGLEAQGIGCSAAINGLLSMPERADVLDRVRLGDIGILLVSPEQLRNRALRRALAQREIGAWVLDEAHCVSKWGHDFRPDYRYVSRFINEKAGAAAAPPILCLTATAKPDVVADMLSHFSQRVGAELKLFDGGATRTNLEFAVVPTTPGAKFAHVHQVLLADLPPGSSGGAIIYCATKKTTQELAEYLVGQGVAAEHFHSGLQAQAKKSALERFKKGELQVIAATNAFGMGIDKPDVRLVIHADMPGTLENYLQEAGRAGRDRESARCVLLYTPEDAERQFGMSARSRLTQREIQAILKSLRSLDRRKRMGGEVVATAGEILAEEHDAVFERDSATDDTRVRTAISWLEEALLLKREENSVQIFPSSLRVRSLDEAKAKLAKSSMAQAYRRNLEQMVEVLIAADADEGVSTDELMGAAGLNADMVRKALYDLEALGIASNDTALTAFVNAGVEDSSNKRLERAQALEADLIEALRESAPDLAKGETSTLNLRRMAQRLKDQGHAQARTESLWPMLRGIAADGRREEGGVGSLQLKRIDAETAQILLKRDWPALDKTARLRRAGAARLLAHLLERLPAGARGADLLAATTLGLLLRAITADLDLQARAREPQKLLDRALMWLHEQDVIRLNKGLAVFRPAMTIRLEPERRRFGKTDFQPLKEHYDEQVGQIHVMAEYVQRGLQAMADALRLAMDYFSLPGDEFLKRWLPDREKEMARQTTPDSWRKIVEALNNPAQKNIVADERELANVLVLAGPGSGKTRVLVHRIAYLLRVKRERADGILALAFNRHAAAEIRRRLRDLVGDDANGVTVLTYHALAMRLAGASFVERAASLDDGMFENVLREAIALLKGEGLAPDEADEQRSRLMGGFRWILVDEYQDIAPTEYELVSALAGRTRQDEDGKLSLFAVGDDDQNVYAFKGASVEFIRRFETDYAAKPSFLIQNYRSSRHIIETANALIAPAMDRMKAAHPIEIDRARRQADPGGHWQRLDPVGKGRVQLIALDRADSVNCQTVAAVRELVRLAKLDSDWDWSRCAVVAREWRLLDPARAYCELLGVPAQMADETNLNVWRLRETQALVGWLRGLGAKAVDAAAILRWLSERPTGPWWALLTEAAEMFGLETWQMEAPAAQFIDWFAEWGREVRRKQSGLLLLTAHRAKGMEFDHVVLLDGAWEQQRGDAADDEARRLFYVAMTRARETLTIMQSGARHVFSKELSASLSVLARPILPPIGRMAELERCYLKPGMNELDIGFAGRFRPGHPLHGHIAALAPGSPLVYGHDGQRGVLLDAQGNKVGRMALAFRPLAGMVCVAAKVHAIQTRTKRDGDEEHRHLVQAEQWEIVLPELVFAPQ